MYCFFVQADKAAADAALAKEKARTADLELQLQTAATSSGAAEVCCKFDLTWKMLAFAAVHGCWLADVGICVFHISAVHCAQTVTMAFVNFALPPLCRRTRLLQMPPWHRRQRTALTSSASCRQQQHHRRPQRCAASFT